MTIENTVPIKKSAFAGGDFWLAVRDMLPILVGVTPFGITCGIMGLSAGLKPAEVIAMSLLVFAGSAQFIAITMIAAGISGWGMLVFTTLLVNLRHLLMGASIAPYLSRLPLPLQALLCFGMADESYALTIGRIQRAGYSLAYQLGANTAMYTTWAISTVFGVVLGSQISDPLAWGLDFIMPITFMVLLIPRLIDRNSLLVCALAAVAAVAGAICLPGKWYIVISAITASAVGGMLEGGRSDAQ